MFSILENDPSCVFLYSLHLLDAVAGSAVEHSIAVVDPGQDQTTSQCLCQFRNQQVSNVSDTDDTDYVTARS